MPRPISSGSASNPPQSASAAEWQNRPCRCRSLGEHLGCPNTLSRRHKKSEHQDREQIQSVKASETLDWTFVFLGHFDIRLLETFEKYQFGPRCRWAVLQKCWRFPWSAPVANGSAGKKLQHHRFETPTHALFPAKEPLRSSSNPQPAPRNQQLLQAHHDYASAWRTGKVAARP